MAVFAPNCARLVASFRSFGSILYGTFSQSVESGKLIPLKSAKIVALHFRSQMEKHASSRL
jgi:hypothetical protein